MSDIISDNKTPTQSPTTVNINIGITDKAKQTSTGSESQPEVNALGGSSGKMKKNISAVFWIVGGLLGLAAVTGFFVKLIISQNDIKNSVDGVKTEIGTVEKQIDTSVKTLELRIDNIKDLLKR